MLNKSNYFSHEMNVKYMSVSQFKSFEKCEAAALAEIDGTYAREKTTALYVGSYIDSYFEGTLKEFAENNPEIFRQRGGILKSPYLDAHDIISRIEKDEMFMRFLSGEKQVVMTGEIEGVDVKIKVDSLLPDKIVDLKIVKDFAPIYKEAEGKLPWYEYWRYDLQGAVYQEIVRQNTGKKLPFYLAAATKERITDIGIWQINQDLLDFELEKFKKTVRYYDFLKQGIVSPSRCEKCDYCKMTKILTVDNIHQSGEVLFDDK